MWSGLDHLCDMDKKGQWLSNPLSFGSFQAVAESWILESFSCLLDVSNSHDVTF